MEKTWIEKLEELKQIHYDSTTPMDSYFTGMYNGIECALATLLNREPQYKSVEQLSFAEIKPQDAVGVDHG